jgi:hypothetical protein
LLSRFDLNSDAVPKLADAKETTVTDETKQAVDGSATPETEPPRAKPKKPTKVEDTLKEIPLSADDAEAKETSQRPEAAPVSKDTKPARRMRFRLVGR